MLIICRTEAPDKKLQLELKTWKAQLPDSLNLDISDVHLIVDRATVHLHLNYSAVWVSLSRSSLLRLVRDKITEALGISKPAVQEDVNVYEISQICIDIVFDSLQLMKLLRRDGLLSKNSLTDMHSIVTINIVLLLASLIQPSARMAAALDDSEQLLESMNGGSRVTQEGMRMVTNFRALISRVKIQLETNKPQKEEASTYSVQTHEQTKWSMHSSFGTLSPSWATISAPSIDGALVPSEDVAFAQGFADNLFSDLSSTLQSFGETSFNNSLSAPTMW